MQEIHNLKTDYELICQNTVNNCLEKIKLVEERYKSKLQKADEQIKILNQDLNKLREVIDRAELKNKAGFNDPKNLLFLFYFFFLASRAAPKREGTLLVSDQKS